MVVLAMVRVDCVNGRENTTLKVRISLNQPRSTDCQVIKTAANKRLCASLFPMTFNNIVRNKAVAHI